MLRHVDPDDPPDRRTCEPAQSLASTVGRGRGAVYMDALRNTNTSRIQDPHGTSRCLTSSNANAGCNAQVEERHRAAMHSTDGGLRYRFGSLSRRAASGETTRRDDQYASPDLRPSTQNTRPGAQFAAISTIQAVKGTTLWTPRALQRVLSSNINGTLADNTKIQLWSYVA